MSIKIIALLFAISVGSVSVPARSQVGSQPSVAQADLDKGLRFDIISIKRSHGDRGPSYRILPNGFRSTGVPLRTIILMAYFPSPLWDDQRIQGAPSWVNNYLFDIEARVAPEDLAAWQSKKQNIVYKAMLEEGLRNMLKERCRLVAHMIPAQATGYDLLVSDRGDRLRRSTIASSPSGTRMPLPDGGVATYIDTDNLEHWIFRDTSMKDLIVFLATRSNGWIRDKTGLTGRYNFELSKRSGADGSIFEDNVPVVWELKTLDLELKKAKIETANLVIDHIEKPSMN